MIDPFNIESVQKTSYKNKLKKIIFNKKTYCVINQCLIIFLHIFLLSIFEPYFYFIYITKLEKQALFDILDSYIYKLNNYYSLISDDIKLHVIDYRPIISNITELLYMDNDNLSMDIKKNILIQKSIYISIQIFSILLIFSIIGIIIRKHISIKYIIIENIIMISLLAYYEYTFFNNVILEYDPISKSEINNYLIDEIKNIIV